MSRSRSSAWTNCRWRCSGSGVALQEHDPWAEVASSWHAAGRAATASPAGGVAAGPQLPPFLSKTYDLVSEPALDGVICWGVTGNSFVVWDPSTFARDVLPYNFKHTNFSSFVRLLNTYPEPQAKMPRKMRQQEVMNDDTPPHGLEEDDIPYSRKSIRGMNILSN